MEGLFVKSSANNLPMTPISFLKRAAIVHGDKTSIVYGNGFKSSWRQTYQTCRRLASGLRRLNISHSDVVVALAPNVPALYELHFGVPMAGATLSALNWSLDASTLATLMKQLAPKIIFVDQNYTSLMFHAMELLESRFCESPSKPLVIIIPELDHVQNLDLPDHCLSYSALLESGDPNFEMIWPGNEFEPISVNFTSGSTGTPKAVVYSHRAAYLNSIGMILLSEITKQPVFLWTVDMFRCNGWCFPWAMAALGGTNICIRENYNAAPETILELIGRHKVNFLCGKPIILNLLAEATNPEHLPCEVDVFVSGVLPPAHVITRVKEMGFNVKVGYGMTEALGPAIMKPWDPEDECASSSLGLNGIYNVMLEDVDVIDPVTMRSVPRDGTTVGEVMFRGNTLMAGYLGYPEGTRGAFKGGWYNTGDVAVRLPCGNIQMKDRAVDIIALDHNGFVSSLEVEQVLASHPDVVEAAVVGCVNDDGESGRQVPIAFVKLKSGSNVEEIEVVKFCVERLQGHMVPRTVHFGDLPKNSTGKIQKFVLRERVNAMVKLNK